MTLVPHFAFPFRISGGSAVVNEQDTDDEIRDAVAVVLSYPQGHRLELPEFGLPDQTFRTGGADAAAVVAAAERWEPRATVDVAVAVFNELQDQLAVSVARREGVA